jgi:hypothetical protein
MGNHRCRTVPWTVLLASVATVALGAGCPTVDLGDTPSDIGLCNPAGGLAYFRDQIWPSFVRPTDAIRGCTRAGGCHNEAGGNALGFRTDPVDVAFNYRQTQIYLNCGQPAASELRTKPLAGIDPHGGMDLITAGDTADVVFLGWFEP